MKRVYSSQRLTWETVEHESRLKWLERENYTIMVSGPESWDTRGRETKRQEWYCECSGDKYLDSGAEVEDTSQETLDTTRWESESRSNDTGI